MQNSKSFPWQSREFLILSSGTMHTRLKDFACDLCFFVYLLFFVSRFFVWDHFPLSNPASHFSKSSHLFPNPPPQGRWGGWRVILACQQKKRTDFNAFCQKFLTVFLCFLTGWPPRPGEGRGLDRPSSTCHREGVTNHPKRVIGWFWGGFRVTD